MALMGWSRQVNCAAKTGPEIEGLRQRLNVSLVEWVCVFTRWDFEILVQ